MSLTVFGTTIHRTNSEEKNFSPCFGGVLLASLALCASPVAYAGSVDNGKSLFNSICQTCHGPLQAGIPPMKAADKPSVIRNASNTVPQMSIIRSLTDQDLDDVATYIARPTTTDADRILDWAEQVSFSNVLGTSQGGTQSASGYRFRYYPTPNMYVGFKDGKAYLLAAPFTTPGELGTVRSFLQQLPAGR